MIGRHITPVYSVSGQISPQDVALLESQGIKSLICNRPDAEEAGQTPFVDIQTAATALGLKTVHIPVSGIPDTDTIETFSQTLEALPQPVLAYCRTGTRCTILWALSQKAHRPKSEIISLAATAGYDVSQIL